MLPHAARSRTRVYPLWVLALILSLAPCSAAAFESVGSVYATGGIRLQDQPAAETRPQIGLGAMFGGRSWPLIPTFHYTRLSGEDQSDLDFDPNTYEFTTHEVGVGAARYWSSGRIQPHLGGGWSRSTTRTEFDATFISDETVTVDRMWLGGGIHCRMDRLLIVGLGGRFQSAVTSNDDVGFWSAFMLVGVGWPTPD